MAKRGRPSKYTEKLAAEVCERIAAGESLREICSDAHIPSAGTVRGWVVDDREGFSERYARACEQRAWLWAEELLDIVDDSSNDYVARQRADGSSYDEFNSEAVQRSRLRADTRKWLLSRLIPRHFGDKQQHEHTGEGGGPLQISVVRYGEDSST